MPCTDTQRVVGLSVLAKLEAVAAALVPPPWQHQVRYSGVLAPASTWRSRIVPQPPAEPRLAEPHACDQDALACELDHNTQRTVPKGKGCRYWPWRLLKSRTFGEPTTKCSHCEGELTLRAVVQDRDSIHRILSHLGLPTDVPKPAPARGPPEGSRVEGRRGGVQEQPISFRLFRLTGT
jgi:hypothetical protein